MLRDRQYHPVSGHKRPRFVRKLVLWTLVCVAVTAGLLYFQFTPVLSDNLQLSCNLPPATPRVTTAPCAVAPSCAPPVEKETVCAENGREPDWADDERESKGGPQEIADVTGPDETLFSLMYANLLDETMARRAAKSLAAAMAKEIDKKLDAYSPLKTGCRYSLTLDQNGGFQKVTLEWDASAVFHAERDGDSVRAWKEDVVLDYKVETLTFRVNGAFIDSVLRSGEDVAFARALTNVFLWDIDFASEARRGDVCKVLFERRYADDRPSGYGDILCAVYHGKKVGKKTAVLFQNKYFSEEGVILKKDFLRTPLKTIRVTSKFGKRFHPVLRVWRKHCGVDYGAPTGTPVMSVANGVVTFSGWQNGYGNYICVKHDNGYETRYGHLSRILVRCGQRVKQEQKIGLVGMTGIATGPHLDFQLLRKGVHENPEKVKMVRTLETVAQPLMPRFRQVIHERLISLEGLEFRRTARTADSKVIR